MRRRRGPRLLLLVGALGLLGTGCVTAGVSAVGPLISIAGYFLDRGVDRTFAASLPHVWEATLATLARMDVPVEKAERDEQRGAFEATGGGMTISGELAKLTPGMTRVSVTANGGIRPDKETAREVLDRVALLLQEDATELTAARAAVRSRAQVASAPPAPGPAGAGPAPVGPATAAAAAAAPAPEGPSADHLAAIRKELEALRAELGVLREFRAALVREFGIFRADVASRLGSPQAARASAADRPAADGGPVLRVRESVVRTTDLPESVLVVSVSSAPGEGNGLQASSPILHVDPAGVPSFARAAAPPLSAPGLRLAGPLRSVGVLAPISSALLPIADDLGGGAAHPAPPR